MKSWLHFFSMAIRKNWLGLVCLHCTKIFKPLISPAPFRTFWFSSTLTIQAIWVWQGLQTNDDQSVDHQARFHTVRWRSEYQSIQSFNPRISRSISCFFKNRRLHIHKPWLVHSRKIWKRFCCDNDLKLTKRYFGLYN